MRVDGNSPSFWRDGRFHFITSTGDPTTAIGGSQFSFDWVGKLVVTGSDHLPMWIESAWVDEDGTVYGWYHHEPGGLCPGATLTAPRIGAVVSYDGGQSFEDLGIIVTSGEALDCKARNGYFAGGNGDFSVILDREKKYFYFFFTHYGGDVQNQGIAMARLAFEERAAPVGVVQKYFEGEWNEPGLEGRVTPVFPANVAWQREDSDSFWGAAIHWNTHLESYVILMNRSCCEPWWPQEGVYVTFNRDLTNPAGWSVPIKILAETGYHPGFYPQVIGLGAGESDSLVGEIGRLFIMGRSKWEIVFDRADQPDEQLPPVSETETRAISP